MEMAEPFKLSGTREVVSEDDPPAMWVLVVELERAVNEDTPLISDASKALVESACKTILNDRGVKPENKWDFPKLFWKTIESLSLSQYIEGKKAEKSLTSVMRGLQQAIQGLSESRNLDGFMSHGPDGYKIGFDKVQRVFAARAADAIVHFLFSAHRNYPYYDQPYGRLYYSDYEEFNEFVDEIHNSIEIFGMRLKPSEVLFNADPDHQTYREALIDYKNNPMN
jgi:hypothetical protein